MREHQNDEGDEVHDSSEERIEGSGGIEPKPPEPEVLDLFKSIFPKVKESSIF